MGNGDREANEPGDDQEELGTGLSFRDRFRDAKKSCGGQNQRFLREIIGFDNGKGVITKVTPAYREVILDGDIPEVSNKKKNFQVFYASCLWFQELEVITEADVIDLQAIR